MRLASGARVQAASGEFYLHLVSVSYMQEVHNVLRKLAKLCQGLQFILRFNLNCFPF